MPGPTPPQPYPQQAYPQPYPYAYPASGVGGRAQPFQQRLQHALHALKRFWWMPVLACLVITALTAYRISLEPTVFESQARLYISGRLQVSQTASYYEELGQFYGTQRELLLSSTLAKRAADRAQVLHPKLIPCLVELDIRQARASSVIEITASGLDQGYVAAYLDALVTEFFNYRKEVRAKSSDTTLTLLYQAVQERETELRDAQTELRRFRETNDVIVWQEQGVQTGQRITTLQGQIASLTTEQHILSSILNDGGTNGTFTADALAALDAADNTLRSNAGGDRSRHTPLEQLSNLDEEVRLLTLQQAELSVYLLPKHPKMQSLAQAIERAQAVREQYLLEAREWCSSRVGSIDITLNVLGEALDEAEVEAREASVRLAGYTHLSDNVDRIKKLYERLLDLLQNVDVNKNLDSELLSIMEPASPAVPATREIPKRLLQSGFLGLFLGLGIVWFIGRYDDRVLTVSDIEDLIDEQVLGLVPTSTSELRDPHVSLLAEQDRRHSFAESFRNIRSSLLFVKGEGAERKTILVTSSVPAEGKSTVAANLAAVLAMGGARVLLIDGDLRRGTLHEITGTDPRPGLSDYLTDPAQPDPVRPTKLPRLSIIPAGKPVTNSGELFLGHRFQELMDRVKSEFDHVVVDSAPVFAADDATTLAPRFDATLFVTRSGFTRGRMAHRALKLLRQRNSRILGVVLNRATAAAKSYYYGYSHYYGGPDGAKPAREPALRFGNPVGGGTPRTPTPPASAPETPQPRSD